MPHSRSDLIALAASSMLIGIAMGMPLGALISGGDPDRVVHQPAPAAPAHEHSLTPLDTNATDELLLNLYGPHPSPTPQPHTWQELIVPPSISTDPTVHHFAADLGNGPAVSDDDPSFSCVDDGNRICGPGNAQHAPAGMYDQGGVLMFTWDDLLNLGIVRAV